MDFEDELRQRLHSNASGLTTAGRGLDHVIGRARTRRRHRRAAAGALGGAALLAGTVAYVATDGTRSGPAFATFDPLPSTGPLELEWHETEGGLTWDVASSVAPDGAIYALSTAPGARIEDDASSAKTLYALGDDSSWHAVSGDLGLADIAPSGSVLYGISTAPGTAGGGDPAVVSTSDDGGRSWDSQDLPAIPAPSDAVAWHQATRTGLATAGGTGVAVVTTSFWIDLDELPGVDGLDLDGVTTRPGTAGLALYDQHGSADATGATTTVPATSAAGSGEPILVVPWSDLGIDGAQDLHRTEVWVDSEAGWTRVDGALADAPAVSGTTTIGDEVVVTAYSTDGLGPDTAPNGVAYASADGRTWRQVAVPSQGLVVGLGDAWVMASEAGRELEVSTDGGATWGAVPLPPEASGLVMSPLASGPLGLAVTTTRVEDGRPAEVLVTRDLENWSVLDLTAAAPDASAGPPPPVVVGTDRVVVMVGVDGSAEPGDPSRSRTLTGTPVRVEESSATSTSTSVP